MTAEAPEFRWRSIALPALLPTLLFSTGQGALVPLIPTLSTDLGAGLAVAGLISAMLLVGELVGDIPSGWLVSRVGERAAMMGAAVVAILGLLTTSAAPNPVILGAGIFLIGLGTAVFALARHAFMTSFVPLSHRARALSTLGGTFRLGLLLGPFISAGVITLTGTSASAVWVNLSFCVGALIVLAVLPDPASTFGSVAATRRGRSGSMSARDESVEAIRAGERIVPDESMSLFATLRRFAPLLLRLGVGAAIISALRASRQVLLPLWAVSIGLDPTTTAIIIGSAGIVDFALFYTGGQIMDRFGRLFTAVPSIVGLGVGHIGLALTHDLPGREVWFVVLAVALSLANGVGAGLLMTLGADLAPPAHPAPFLGAWRFSTDAGAAMAPLVISGVTALVSISAAAATLGTIGLLGAVILVRYLPRYSPRT
ncbi:MAG: MFS transporter [Naasia sp.]